MNVFRKNGYLENVIKCTIERRVKSFKSPPMFGPSVSETAVVGKWVARFWLIECLLVLSHVFQPSGHVLFLVLSPCFLSLLRMVCPIYKIFCCL